MLKKLIIILLIVTCVLAKRGGKEGKESKEKENKRKFNEHLKRFGRNYDNLPEEVKIRRLNNYLRTLDLIDRHNKNPKNKFKLGSNEYSDRDPKRFVEEMCRTKLPAMPRALPNSPAVYPSTNPARTAVDWRSQYTVPIISQGACGSCWAFAAVSVIEAFNQIRGSSMTALSQQNIVDCDTVDNGCNGGWPKRTFDWLKNTYGKKLATAANYPYTSGSTRTAGLCKKAPFVSLPFTNTFQFYINGNFATLKQIISNYGPVAIAMYVSNSGLFQNYRSGIFSDPGCPGPDQCFTVNHAMVAVGYGKTSSGEEYFLLRNSWGTYWGESGYMRMAMGNTCNTACWAMGVE